MGGEVRTETGLRTKDDIWEGDLFQRRYEAEHLEAYIQSVFTVTKGREDASAFTISVNAPYGVGKTYFLKRLEEHLSHSHPVAYVDAWKDDLADEPLTALVSTLKEALKVYERRDKEKILDVFDKVKQNAGKIAAITGKEMLRRGASFIFSETFITAFGAILKSADEAQAGRLADQAATLGEKITEAIEGEFKGVAPGKLMQGRIEAFEEGQQAIKDLKDSLKALVASLETDFSTPPIIIIIDELDRCRPTYAVKLLEEIKHLFDVPGLVFILGMNDEQLSKSLAGAYGPEFDGKAYLRRFINREYSLSMPDLEPLLQGLLIQAGIPQINFSQHAIADEYLLQGRTSLASMIAAYMGLWELSTRDAFRVIDTLQTCVFLSNMGKFIAPMIVVQIMEKVSGKNRSYIIRENNPQYFKYKFRNAFRGEDMSVGALEMCDYFARVMKYSGREFSNSYGNMDYYTRTMADFLGGLLDREMDALHHPNRYNELVEAVGQFSILETNSMDREDAF